MWRRFENAATELQSFAKACASGDLPQRADTLDKSADLTNRFAESYDEISQSSEPAAVKVRKAEKSLTSIRASSVILADILKSDGIPGLSQGATVLVTATLVEATCYASFSPLHNAESVSAVPVSTIKSLLKPFWALEPLAKFLAATPLDDWPVLQGTDQAELGADIADLIERIMVVIDVCVRWISALLTNHSKARKLVTQGAIRLGPLMAALWALGPVTSWDALSLTPTRARELVFRWNESVAFLLSQAGLSHIEDIHGSMFEAGTVPMVARVAQVVAEAAVSGDAAEHEQVKDCLYVLGLLFTHIKLARDDLEGKAFEKACARAADPESVAYALSSVAALREAAASPNADPAFSLHALLLAAAVSGLSGSILRQAACARASPNDTRSLVTALHSELFIECLEAAAGAWTDVVRRATISIPPGFDFFMEVSRVPEMSLIGELFSNTLSGPFQYISQGDNPVMKKTRDAIPKDLSVCALAARGARAAAEAAVGMAAAVALRDPAEAASNARGVMPYRWQLERAMAGHLQCAAQGYSAVAAGAAGWGRSGVKIGGNLGDAGLVDLMARAAHASHHAALVLSSGGTHPGGGSIWLPPPDRDQMGLNKPDMSLFKWHIAGMLFTQTLLLMGQAGRKAAAGGCLHALLALAASPESFLRSDLGDHILEVFTFLPDETLKDITAVLLPTDTRAVEKLIRCVRDSRAAHVLGHLIDAARSVEDLEERQSARLELIGALPRGVCANLRCNRFEAVPPSPGEGEEMKKCSGCRVARFCSMGCMKIDWKWGHKGPCQLAARRERDGG